MNNDLGPEETGNSTRFSNEYRHQLVTALKRRLNKTPNDSSVNYGNNSSGGYHNFSSIQDEHSHPDMNYPSYDNQENHSFPSDNRGDPVEYEQWNDGSEAALIDARTSRIAQTEAAIRQEMFKECTFRPRIKELPDSYGATGHKELCASPFYNRVSKWQNERNIEAQRRKEMTESNEVSDCTFQPRINRNSQRFVKETASLQAHPSTANARQRYPATAGKDVCSRLFKHGDVIEQRKQRVQEEKIKRDKAQHEQNHRYKVFQNRNTKFNDVKPKVFSEYDMEQRRISKEKPHHSLRDCTFTPEVRGVRKSMNSAALYCKTPVVDRLTRPITPTPADNSMQAFDEQNSIASGIPMDMNSSFGGSMGSKSFMNMSSMTPSATPRRPRRSTSAPPPSDRPATTGPRSHRSLLANDADDYSIQSGGRTPAVDKATRKLQFEQFLNRQAHMELHKSQEIARTERGRTPTFKPQLIKNPVYESHHKGEFLDRLDRDVVRRVENGEKNMINSAATKDCTFEPKILTKSAHLRSRSPYEMSRGDCLKKDSNQKLSRLRSEQELFSGITFKPELSAYTTRKGIKSILKIAQEDPKKEFTTWANEKQEMRNKKLANSKEELIATEVKDCTFHPDVKNCPQYISRIAKSVKVGRMIRNTHQRDAPVQDTSGRLVQPEWK